MAEVSETDLRREIDRAIASDRVNAARGLLARMWREQPGPACAAFVVSRIEQLRGKVPLTPCRLSILRSFTVEPLVPLLRAAAGVDGIELTVYLSDLGAYAQEILDKASGLYRSEPQLVILAVQTRDLAPELWSGFAQLSVDEVVASRQRVVGQLSTLVKAFRSRSQAQLIIHGLEVPAFPRQGLIDRRLDLGQAEAIHAINADLRELARQQPSVNLLDYDGLVARHGRFAWHDEPKWLTMRMPIAAPCLVHLSNEWLRFVHPLCGRVAKVLAVDLDNTLWGGVIGEDGLDGIAVGPEYPGAAYQALQSVILDLYQRGVILAICSKNNPEDARQALEQHPGMLLQPRHFAAMRINWNDKVQNLREIAVELNLGIDAVAFLDDDPAERERVRGALPEVAVIELPGDPMGYARALQESPFFERLSQSEEDRARPQYYAQDRLRTELQREVTSIEDFYRSLSMEAEIAQAGNDSWPRVAQLTQKTNQFNLTTRRYSEQDIMATAQDPKCRVYTLRLRDRFGDHGLVGVAMIRIDGTTWDIDTFLLSCRVIGRTVETAFLATVAAEARRSGAERLRGTFIATKKNAPVKEFYRAHGFVSTDSQDGLTRWELDLRRGAISPPSWVTTRVLERGTAE